MGHAFWKEHSLRGQSKLIGINHFKSLCKGITMVNLCKRGNDISENLGPKFPSKGGAMS